MTWQERHPEEHRRQREEIDRKLSLGLSDGCHIGEHYYPRAPRRTSDCAYGCDCWMGPSRSGGPEGVDPFGSCPARAMAI